MSYMSTLSTATVIKMCLGYKDNCKHVNGEEVSNCLEYDTYNGYECRGVRLLWALLQDSISQNSNQHSKYVSQKHPPKCVKIAP